MGLEEKKEEKIVQLSDKKKREYLIEIISTYLKTNISLMNYFHAVAPTRKAKFVCNKSIKETEEAIAYLYTIKHIELLEYLYSSFIGNGVIAYSVSGRLVKSKQLAYYDTEEGFVDFQKEMKEQREKAIAKEEEKKKQQEAIKKAKEEGKNVEMVWDKDSKTVKPLIVEDKTEA